jgi:hypothetical protein
LKIDYIASMNFYVLRTHLLAAGVLAMLFASCDLELPQRIQTNTTFGLHVPVGDIGELQEIKDALQYTDTEKISGIFGEEMVVNAYFYTKKGHVIPMPKSTAPNKNVDSPLNKDNAIDPGEVRSLLIHFPLARLNLNLNEYLNTEVTMPAVTLPDLPPGASLPSNLPPIPIPLGEMSEWIDSVELNGKNDYTTVTLKGGAVLQDSLRMAVPEFGIGTGEGDFQKGAAKDGDLVFTANTVTQLHPKKTAVNIYLQLTKVPPKGGSYPVEVDLKWTKAEVLPGDSGSYEDTIDIPVAEFSDFLTKYKIASIPCYIYVGGPFSDSNKVELGIQADNDWLVGDENTKKGTELTQGINFSALYKPPLLRDDYYEGELHEGSDSFNLAAKVNNSAEKDIKLKYWIKRLGTSWTVLPNSNDIISADMVVVLPFQFNVEPQPEEIITVDNKEYIDIFSMVKYGLNDNGDLFGRDQVRATTVYLTNICFSAKSMENTFFANDLFLHIYDDNVVDELIKISSGGSFSADIAGSPHIPMPIHPKFSVYIQKPKNDLAVIKIAPKPKTGSDVFMVQISADVTGISEYEQDF